jgi:hypothetical protein
MNLTSETSDTLLQRFKPFIQFDSREKYFPCTVEYYLAHCECFNEKGDKVTNKGVMNAEGLNPYLTVKELKLKAQNINDCMEGFKKISDAPFYATIQERQHCWVLQYVMFYTLTSGRGLCGLMQITSNKEADFKFIHMIVDKKTQTLQWVNFNKEDVWYTPQEFQQFQQHILVYNSLETHNLYPVSGCNYLWCGLAWDENDASGKIWDAHLEEINDTTPWNTFQGTFGDLTNTPLYCDWWLNPIV